MSNNHTQEANLNSVGHLFLKASVFLGVGFIITHIITVTITCVVEGFNWGINAWVLDSMGFIAGVVFTVVCRNGSQKGKNDFHKGYVAILIWSLSSIFSRLFDIAMLFGIVKFSEIYITPEGPVLFSNIISEILFGFTFNVTACIGALLIIKTPLKK